MPLNGLQDPFDRFFYPSNMMDGFVAEIREGLDQAGYQNIPIMSYGIKYASSFS
jgi:delta-aminolevulinic acid dehydratase/porphobilinogen synthase